MNAAGPTYVSRRLSAADYPPHTRLIDVTRPLVAAGYVLRQTRRGLIAVRNRRASHGHAD
jgi:hypothetical protein